MSVQGFSPGPEIALENMSVYSVWPTQPLSLVVK